MEYIKFNSDENKAVRERRVLAAGRIREILTEETVEEPLRQPFREMADFLLYVDHLAELSLAGTLRDADEQTWRERNERLWGEVLSGTATYAQSYLNPAYAAECCGDAAGQLISFLYSELQAGVLYAYEGRVYALVMLEELLIGVYNLFENCPLTANDGRGVFDSPEFQDALGAAKDLIYWFFHDYCEIFAGWQVREMVDADYDFCTGIIMESDLRDLSCLYYYGLPVGENERRTAAYLNSLPESDIQSMADTYTEGYRIGFEVTGKDLSKKKTVEIRYAIGFERMMRAAIRNFEAMGLRPTISLQSFSSYRGKCAQSGAYSTSIDRQFMFDHREDRAYYFDKSFVERRLEALRTAFEHSRKMAAEYAGPAVLEVFGEEPFAPEPKAAALHYNAKQQELNVYNASMSGQITNTYIKGEERSFTIIAYPIPEIGAQFEEIFRETVKINTLDYKTYQRIQQKLIDVLDGADHVEIRGRNGNKTDLSVSIRPLPDPENQTAFENCVADVNIPVGEVFTSPVLAGTCGLLHVSEVFLNGLKFNDLQITFRDGMVSDYSCANFDSEKENKKYIRDNVLMHHETLPMGEFAIGTNTTAYRMGIEYGIMGRLPILIAEKCGPHFAVGDTCYSHAEDTAVFNPDGKEIISRDNEVSIRRKEDLSAAYFNCHTDITIPYHELDTITAVRPDGERLALIAGGKFVVPGTEELNRPLEE